MSLLDDAVIRPSGEAAVVLEYGDAIDPEIHTRVLAADRAIVSAGIEGVDEVVPSYRSVLLHLDPLRTTPEEVRRRLAGLEPAAVGDGRGRVVEVPMDASAGEDLHDVAAAVDLSVDEVLAVLTGAELRVYLHGFAPGFVYLGGVPPALHLPRRASPRDPVAPGSVLLAAGQAALCPLSMPTGWWVVGRTDLPLFDVGSDPPVPLRAGDHVRFVTS